MINKKIILILLSTWFIVGLNAQTEETRNKYIIGASTNFGINFGNSGDFDNAQESHSHFSIKPYIGRILDKRWTIGVSAQYDIKGNAYRFRSVQDLGLGAFGRYLFNPDNDLKLYLEASSTLFGRHNTGSGIAIHHLAIKSGLKAGLLYDINSKTRVSMQLGDISHIYRPGGGRGDYQKYYPLHDLNINFSPTNIRLGVEFKF